MEWWIWILAGLALMAVEVIIPGGIILLFFGAAAMVVGVLTWLGIGGPQWMQWALFSVLSVVSLLTLRGPILRKMKGSTSDAEFVDTLVGTAVVVNEPLAPGGEGKVELRGTSWGAHNVGGEPLAVGDKALVERIDGLSLYIRRSET